MIKCKFHWGAWSMEIARYWDPPVLTVDLTCEPPRGKQAMPDCLALSATHKSCSSSPWAQGDSARVRELQEGDANEWHAEVTKRRVLPGTEDNRWFSVGTKMSLFPHETTTWMKKRSAGLDFLAEMPFCCSKQSVFLLGCVPDEMFFLMLPL